MKTCGTKEYKCDCGTLFSRYQKIDPSKPKFRSKNSSLSLLITHCFDPSLWQER
jgi:hypothetical protein